MLAQGYLNVDCLLSSIWNVPCFLSIELSWRIQTSLHGIILYFWHAGNIPWRCSNHTVPFLTAGREHTQESFLLISLQTLYSSANQSSWENAQLQQVTVASSSSFLSGRTRHSPTHPLCYMNHCDRYPRSATSLLWCKVSLEAMHCTKPRSFLQSQSQFCPLQRAGLEAHK